jgi:anti-anti-sigma factor
MLIEVKCPNGHVLHVKDKYAGKIGACPRCSAPVRVPFPSQIAGNDRLGTAAKVARASEDAIYHGMLHERPEDAFESSSSSLSILPGKGKLCLACGKEFSQSFSVCPRCGTPVSTYRLLGVKKEGEALVIQFAKRRILDEPTVKEIAEELGAMADREGSRDFVLDVSNVVALSSLMLGKLVMLQKRMEREKRKLLLRNVGPEVREVLEATKLDQVLHMEGAE